MLERWLSVEEIAKHLGIKRDTVYKWIKRKGLPAHKVGRLWKFQRSEIDDWVRQDEDADRTTQSIE
jgi:excisionase family DNA binding protein